MSDIEDEAIAITSFMFSCYKAHKAKSKRKTRQRLIWAKGWLLERNKKGAYHTILNELKLTDFEHFCKFLRMNTDTFEVCF